MATLKMNIVKTNAQHYDADLDYDPRGIKDVDEPRATRIPLTNTATIMRTIVVILTSTAMLNNLRIVIVLCVCDDSVADADVFDDDGDEVDWRSIQSIM